MVEPGAAIDRQAILALRRQVRFQDGRPYDGRCSKVAAALEVQFGWKREWGRLRVLAALLEPARRWLYPRCHRRSVRVALAGWHRGAQRL